MNKEQERIELIKKLEQERVDQAEKMLKSLQETYRKHHEKCYNRTEFEFEWTTLAHPGIWVFGGSDKNVKPTVEYIKWCVPKEDEEEGWYIYIGPRPSIKDEYEN